MKRLGLIIALLLIALIVVGPLNALRESFEQGKLPKADRLHWSMNNVSRVWAHNWADLEDAVLAALYPTEGQAPELVVMVPADSWQTALAALNLLAHPAKAALVLINTDSAGYAEQMLQKARELAPRGSRDLGGVQVIAVGKIADQASALADAGFSVQGVGFPDSYVATSAALAELGAELHEQPRVAIVVDGEADAAFALPAATWAVHRGTPVLFAQGGTLDPATAEALDKLAAGSSIYLLTPPGSPARSLAGQLAAYGVVREIGAAGVVENSVSFARYYDSASKFGWQVGPETVDGSHRFLLARADNWQFAVVGAQLFSQGIFGPLLLTTERNSLPVPLEKLLFANRPDWWVTPAEGPFQHTWILGNAAHISYSVQGRVSFLHEMSNYENMGNQGVSGLEAVTMVWIAMNFAAAIWVWCHLTTHLYQLAPFMKLAWVLLALVLGPVALWAYYTSYRGYGHQVAKGVFPRPLWVQVLAATSSTMGYGLPVMIGTAFILTFRGLPLFLNSGPLFVFGTPMMQSVIWSYLAAVVFNALLFVPLMLALKEDSSWWDTVRANWLTVLVSMTSISIGMMTSMWWFMMEYLDMMPEESNLLWWGSMFAASIVGMMTGYIGNWALVIRGEKKGSM